MAIERRYYRCCGLILHHVSCEGFILIKDASSRDARLGLIYSMTAISVRDQKGDTMVTIQLAKNLGYAFKRT